MNNPITHYHFIESGQESPLHGYCRDLIRDSFADDSQRTGYKCGINRTAKKQASKDDISGRIMFAPSLPGQKCSQNLPYHFDEVLCLRCENDEDGKPIRFLQTFPDSTYCCKDRSGALQAYEEADLGSIIRRINESNS